MSKKKETRTKTTAETRMLKCDLTDEELLAAGADLAAKLDDLKTCQAERDSVNKGYKAKEAEIEAQVQKGQILVRNKYDIRNVDCENVQDFRSLMCTVTRKDTGETVIVRKLTEDEKQSTLPFDGEGEN